MRGTVSSTILLSLSESDGGRCAGREVFHQKVLARPDPSRLCSVRHRARRAAGGTGHGARRVGCSKTEEMHRGLFNNTPTLPLASRPIMEACAHTPRTSRLRSKEALSDRLNRLLCRTNRLTEVWQRLTQLWHYLEQLWQLWQQTASGAK